MYKYVSLIGSNIDANCARTDGGGETYLDTTWLNYDESKELAGLQQAYNSQAVHAVRKEELRIKNVKNMLRLILLCSFLWMRENTSEQV